MLDLVLVDDKPENGVDLLGRSTSIVLVKMDLLSDNDEDDDDDDDNDNELEYDPILIKN